MRIASAVREEMLEAVTVFTTDDAGSHHVAAGDTSVALPGNGVAGYLDVDAVIAAAREAGADAIHPGYGFLSERADFARACAEAGIAFVGPSASHLDLFGDKARAREVARAARIPLLEASPPDTDVHTAREMLGRFGGVMLKAVAGGGGRGMRPVTDEADLAAAFASCQREAMAAFGDDRLYAEALLVGARHVEVQFVGDGTRVEHLWERDCTLQRRRQKLIEFAPAFWLDDDVRLRLRDAAVGLGEHVGYQSLGTVEFLVSGDRFAFIECNPRLQVEHTVTEETTGVDLVRTQLRLAAGETLSALGLFSAPPVEGVAVQLRVNAESLDASGNLYPTGGTVSAYIPPSGVRVDATLAPGTVVNPAFDSMLAKVVVTAADPDSLLVAARNALDDLVIAGVDTNIALLTQILDDPAVASGEIDTTWVERTVVGPRPPAVTTPDSSSGSRPTAEVGLGPDVGDGGVDVVAPMPATVVEISVEPGVPVPAGAQVAVLEAMKMEHVIVSSVAGEIDAWHVVAGDTVEAGAALCTITPGEVDVADDRVDEMIDLDTIRPDLAESLERHAHGLDENRPEAVARRRKLGKRTARENVADLVDPDSLIEYGPLVVAAQRKRRSLEELREKTPADGMIGGVATVDGAPVAVASYDYTVLAGTQGLFNHVKKDRLFDVAARSDLPFVFFTEGGGGRPGDTDGTGVAGLDCLAFSLFAGLSGRAPMVAIVSGRCFAGNAALAGMCDVIIATEDTNLGMGGPAMIEGGGLGTFAPEDIGPIDEQVANGVVDVRVDDEAEAVAVARRYLSYFTHRTVDDVEVADQRELRHLIPENRVRAYDIRRVIDGLFDTGSVLELRRGYAPAAICALARINGRTVGVIANDPMHLGGAIDSPASDKFARFLRLCDTHGLPVVSLCDTPGFMVGPDVERSGLVREAGDLFVVGANLSVPLFTIVLRKGYGLGAQSMAGGSFRSPNFIVGWPTSEFGGMGLEGAVRLGYRNELASIDDPEEREATFRQMVDRMYEIGKGVNMAAAFEIDDVIDPADTRRWLDIGLRAALD